MKGYGEASGLASLLEQKNIGTPGAESPAAADIRAELDCILSSSGFRKSERLSQFLRFVCESALKGEGSKLNEYVIAQEVFGRGGDYSPNEDSVVRRQAYTLRQKIAEYYAGPGRDHCLQIELPVGRYVPVFIEKHRDASSGQVAVLLAPEVPAPGRKPVFGRTLQIAVALALLSLTWMLGVFAGRAKQSAALDPDERELWNAWISQPEGAVICFSNPMTTVVKQFPFPLPPNPDSDPPRMAVSADQAEQFRRYFALPSGGYFAFYPAKSQTKTGEALGGVSLTALLSTAGVPVRATQSRFLSGENFRNQNLILLGHDEANRWLDPLLTKLPIRMAMTTGEKARRIIDMSASGTPVEYYLEPPKAGESVSRDYALVSMIGGVDGRHQLLLINGLNTEGTQIAMEYLCDPEKAHLLLGELRRHAPGHNGHWHFQIVLRTEVLDQVPTGATLLVVKVL